MQGEGNAAYCATARTRMGWRGFFRASRVSAGSARISVVQRSMSVHFCANAGNGGWGWLAGEDGIGLFLADLGTDFIA